MASYTWPSGGGGGGSGTLHGEAGQEPISASASSVAVSFPNDMSSVDFAIVFSFTNLTDAIPIFLQGLVTARSIHGFTVAFNAPTDSANYVLDWIASADTV